MNRSERRSALKAKRQQTRNGFRPGKTVRPMLHEIDLVFAPIDTFMQQLLAGEVLCTDKRTTVLKSHEGELYEAAPAIRGWVDVWQRLTEQYDLGIDFKPLTDLANRLDADMPIWPEFASVCADVIDQCRAAYRGMDVHQVKEVVNLSETRIKLEELGVV